MPASTTPPAAAPAAPAPEPAAKPTAPAKAQKATTKMSPEQKLDTILAYLEKQDHRARRQAFWHGFRQLLSIVYLGLFLYGGWYLYQNQDALMDTLLKKSTDYALQAAQQRQGSGNTVKVQLDETFLQQLTERLRNQAAQSSSSSSSHAAVLQPASSAAVMSAAQSSSVRQLP